MGVLLDGGVDGFSLKVLEGEAKVLRDEVLLLAVLQVVVEPLQLVHKIINDNPACHFHLLAIAGHIPAQDQVLELVNHEELLEDGVDVADGSQVLEAHVELADLALLRRQDGG